MSLREIRTRATKIANSFRKIKEFEKVHAPKKAEGWLEHYVIQVRGTTLGDIHVSGPHHGMVQDIRAAAVNAVRS